tara:strand:- start:4429 stop:6060 length:1632 start_codon:yes stop_codon:yes gene_type:complete
MNNNFLDTNNFKFLIKYVFNDIKNQTQKDISKNTKYISIFKKLIQTIHKQNINKRVTREYLNNLVIEKCVPFIIKQMNKDQTTLPKYTSNITLSNRPKTSNNYDYNDLNFSNLQLNQPIKRQMPNIVDNINSISSRNVEKNDFSSKLKSFQDERGYNEESKPQLASVNELMGINTSSNEKIDYLKKLNELQNDRNYTNQNNSMDSFNESNNSKTINNNNALKKETNQNVEVEIDNNFLQQLYEKNQTNPTNKNNQLSDLNNDYENNLSEAYSNKLNESYENNLKLNIKDASTQNQLSTFDSSIDNLKENYNKEKIDSEIKSITDTTYINSGYKNKQPSHMVVLDSGILGRSNIIVTTDFSIELEDPIVLDTVCDVYLEFLNLHNLAYTTSANELSGTSLEEVSCFALNIKELPLQTYSNNSDLKDKYIFPNDSYGTTNTGTLPAPAPNDGIGADSEIQTSIGTDNHSSYNIKLKSNYMCTINPTTLSKLNISLFGIRTDANTDTIKLLQNSGTANAGLLQSPAAGANGLNGRILIGLLFKKRL